MTQTQQARQETIEFRVDVHGRTVTGTLTSDADGSGATNLVALLLESNWISQVEIRDAGSVVWTVLEAD
jgi:hypothetical protein